jgi:hypothetical protein
VTVDAAELHAFAIGDRLRRAGEIVAVAQPHHVERLWRGQHRAMAGARMVGMGVRDQRALDRPRTGSIWKPPSLQHTPAGVGIRMSSGRMASHK